MLIKKILFALIISPKINHKTSSAAKVQLRALLQIRQSSGSRLNLICFLVVACYFQTAATPACDCQTHPSASPPQGKVVESRKWNFVSKCDFGGSPCNVTTMSAN